MTPYGLVFLKEKCAARGVSPVIYLNNVSGDKDDVVKDLCDLIETSPAAAARILPLVSFFGQKLKPWKQPRRHGSMDFMWEREWRYASPDGVFSFDDSDVFLGLCPFGRIEEFEEQFDWLRFIDPRYDVRYFQDKIIEAKAESGIQAEIM